MNILALESSCDETSAAVLDGRRVCSNIISSQVIHEKWGGVIPELASRAHVENIAHVVHAALDEANLSMKNIDAIACTTQPGLAGALLVGANYSKGLALRYSLPCVPVNHIEGHLFSGFLEEQSLSFPVVVLVVSGGHTSLFFVRSYTDYEILGSTRDDAAGEAFDKTAKMLGLGYPGGPKVDKLAQQGTATSVKFPRALMHEDNYEFSFSGMKTAVRKYLNAQFPEGVSESALPNICASLQEAIVEVLVSKTRRAALEYKAKGIVIAGGVSANSLLRSEMGKAAQSIGVAFVAPRLSYSLDNAAMIGFVAAQRLEQLGKEHFQGLDFEVNSQAMRMHRHGGR